MADPRVHLALANRHIAEAKVRLSLQRERVSRWKKVGGVPEPLKAQH
jgi:hypothetical protein